MNSVTQTVMTHSPSPYILVFAQVKFIDVAMMISRDGNRVAVKLIDVAVMTSRDGN